MVIAVLLDKFFDAKNQLKEEQVEKFIDYHEHPLDNMLDDIVR